MINLYLTSSPTGVYLSDVEPDFEGLDPANGMVDRLWEDWRDDTDVLLIAATPDAYEINDGMRDFFERKLEETELPFNTVALCDYRNWEECMEHLYDYDVIILGGGHVPTQNAFFQLMELPERIQEFDGIVMGISAGSMNCAETVYAQPEDPGESIDPEYERFIPGLGLIDLNVLPHYNAVKDNILDDRRLYEDITCEDSYGHEFFAICDGSFVLMRDGEITIFGEAYRIAEGEMEQICENGEYVELT